MNHNESEDPMPDTSGDDAFAAAEQAAFAAFGDLGDARTIDRLRSALAAHRAALTAAGMLRAPVEITVEAAETAARFLAEESRFPRYEGDGWRLILRSEVDADLAYGKAAGRTPRGDDAHTRDLQHAHRVVLKALKTLPASTLREGSATPGQTLPVSTISADLAR